jgi:hypothetical protein
VRRSVLVALVAACALGSSCGGESGDDPFGSAAAETTTTEWATPDELAWLSRLGDWNDELEDALGAAIEAEEDDENVLRILSEPGPQRRSYVEGLEPYERCSRSLRSRVGRPPPGRLEFTMRRLLLACRFYEQHVATIVRGLALGEEDAIDRANEGFLIGAEIVDAAFGALPWSQRQPLPRIRGMSSRSRIEPELSRVAEQLAEKDVEVRCWSHEDWRTLLRERRTHEHDVGELLGFARTGGGRIHLSPDTCLALVDLRYRRLRPRDQIRSYRLADAVDTLAHEAMHSSGIADEAKAECYAVQLIERAAQDLGVERAYAEHLAETYWDDYPSLEEQYRSSECRNGGEHDLHEETSAFP